MKRSLWSSRHLVHLTIDGSWGVRERSEWTNPGFPPEICAQALSCRRVMPFLAKWLGHFSRSVAITFFELHRVNTFCKVLIKIQKFTVNDALLIRQLHSMSTRFCNQKIDSFLEWLSIKANLRMQLILLRASWQWKSLKTKKRFLCMTLCIWMFYKLIYTNVYLNRQKKICF